MAWDSAQDAALLDKLRRENAEFAEWSASVQAGKARLEGPERDAYRAGYQAGRERADDEARMATTAKFTPRQLVAFAVGFGEGRAQPEAKPGEKRARSVADILANR